jgi:hypothetical protein
MQYLTLKRLKNSGLSNRYRKINCLEQVLVRIVLLAVGRITTNPPLRIPFRYPVFYIRQPLKEIYRAFTQTAHDRYPKTR